MIEHLSLLKQVRKEWTCDQYCMGEFAVDSSGTPCRVDAPEAVAWCVQGKMMQLLHMPDLRTFWAHPLRTFLNATAHRLFDINAIAIVNNEFGHTAILRVLDACIEELERKWRRR